MGNHEQVVNEELTTPTPPEGENPEKVINTEEVTDPAQPGDKTPKNELLSSLQTEREKRRIVEEKNRLLEDKINQISSPSLDEVEEEDEDPLLSDEGKTLKKEITEVKSKVSNIEKDAEIKKVFGMYPEIKEKEAEFNEYRDKLENLGMPLATAAKAFLAENGLLPGPRKGLEKTTGGDKQTAPASGMTAKEVKSLRENDFKEYSRLVAEDKLKIID